MSHSYSRLDARELASADDRAAVVARQLDETSNRDAGFGPVHWLSANPNACTNTRFGVAICSLPNVLRRPHMHTESKELGADAQKSNMGCSSGHSWATLGGD